MGMNIITPRLKQNSQCPRCAWPQYTIVAWAVRRKATPIRRCDACFTEWRGQGSPDERDNRHLPNALYHRGELVKKD